MVSAIPARIGAGRSRQSGGSRTVRTTATAPMTRSKYQPSITKSCGGQVAHASSAMMARGTPNSAHRPMPSSMRQLPPWAQRQTSRDVRPARARLARSAAGVRHITEFVSRLNRETTRTTRLFRHCLAANLRSAHEGAEDLRRLWPMVGVSSDGRTAPGRIATVAIGSVFHHCSGHGRGRREPPRQPPRSVFRFRMLLSPWS
jgi:hypothetical protein